MPLTEKGEKILHNMESEYGTERGKSVFYASKNAGKISGVDADEISDDEHIGFEELEHELAHEKGVRDPKAVAAKIGMEKYGKAGMEKKAAAGRDSLRSLGLVRKKG